MAFVRSWSTLALSLALAVTGGSAAHAAATDWVGDARAAVRLVTATDSAADQPIDAGLQFRFGPGWHGYWRTPGDAGIAPMIDWSASDNLDKESVAWPAPARLVVEGLQNSVYEGTFTLPVALTPKTPHEPVHLRVTVGYAACANICVPYEANLDLALQPGAGGSSAEAGLIQAARAQVPGSPAAAGFSVVGTALSGAGSAGSGRTLVVDLLSRSEPFEHPDLFVEGVGSGMPAAPQVALHDGGRAARLTVSLPGTEPLASPLTLTLVDGARSAEFVDQALPPAGSVGLGWLAALASALLGGLVLNLMPCVLPVLSIKLLGLTRHAGAGRSAIRYGFMATALGIMTCFVLLAGVLVGLQWSGASLGWGIQFQQPWFLAGMATLTVLFGASFFEWLPIGLPSAVLSLGGTRRRAPLIEAFLTGVFATLLATPCSAPFVGTAVGFALTQGPAEILAVFLCLGIGMALPYWAGALFPGVVRWMPRPGRWMLVLRQVLGLLLIGTAVWLLVVLASVAGFWVAGSVGLLLALLLGYRAWVKDGLAGDRRRPRIVTAALAFAPLALSLVLTPSVSQSTTGPGWQAFDPDLLPGLVGEGKVVLVDVTATWCLTCKVNDLAALDRPEVSDRLGRPGIVRMRADWSRPNPVIASYLNRFGRYGIPLDVVYGPDRPNGEALPELLTPRLVLDALDHAAAGAAVAARNGPAD